MKLSSLGLLALLAVAVSTAAQERGLSQVRHALFVDQSTAVEADLRRLAERGDRASMHLLANIISSNPKHAKEATELYKKAFADGRGEVRALTSFVRFLDRQPQQKAAQRGYVYKALQQFPLERDPYTLEAALESFVAYPAHLALPQIESLIRLYDRSCIELCSSDLYRAVYAEHTGDREQAVHWYEQAVRSNPRAVSRYYLFLGDDRDALFEDFAQRLQPEREQLIPEVNFLIAEQLSNITQAQFDQQKTLLLAARLQRQLSESEIAQQQQYTERHKAKLEIAQDWNSVAIDQDYAPAMHSRINYMLSNSDDFGPADTEALIARLEALDPLRARVAKTQIKMAPGWSSLDPEGALKQTHELIADGLQDGHFLLSRIYSLGILNEPDQAKALAILYRLAEQGAATAHFRIAGMYLASPALCRDYSIAYAHARIAYESGDQRAKNLIRQAELLASAEQLEQGKQLYKQLTAGTPQ